MGVRIELECDACGEKAQIAVTQNPAPTPEDFLTEEEDTGQGLLGELEKQGWRLQVQKGIVVAACCPAHFDAATRRLKGELGARRAARTRAHCPNCHQPFEPVRVAGQHRCNQCGEPIG